MSDCHSVLLRQLKRLGLSEKQLPDDTKQWHDFLQRISKTYQQADQDRYTLERSLDLSSREMRDLYDQLKLSSRSELGRERALLWQVMHLLPDIIYFKALDDSYMGCNEAFCHYAGKPEAEIIGAYDNQLFPKSFARYLLEIDRDVVTHGQTINTEETWRDPQQLERIFEFYRTPLHDDHDELLGILAFGHDISERKANEEALRRSAIVFESTTDGVVISNARGRIVAINRAFTRIMGYTQQEAEGQAPFLLDSGRHEADYYKGIKQALMREGNWQGELWTRNKDGGLVPTWASISQVKNTTGQIGNYVTVFSDISHIKESQRKLEHLANHDPLTGLPNRMLFIDRLQTALHAAERDAQKVAVLFMDLDRFKMINDTQGHPLGDTLLQEVSERLRQQVRESDTVARLGGDEFIISLPAIQQASDAALVAQKILQALLQAFVLQGQEIYAPTSIGISIYPHDGSDPATLIKHADTAMYRAKDRGGNTYQFYTEELSERAFEHFALETSLRHALKREEFTLHYQPQYCAASGDLLGAEALLRWHHPDLGLVYPDHFIHMAEEIGLMNELGDWILQQVCQQMLQWDKAGLKHLRMSINLSCKQVLQHDFAKGVEQCLKTYHLQPERLVLELTESVMMQQTDRVMQTLARLRTLGVKIAIDDFGTGYSSLAYLKRFDVHFLKIDKSFVRDVNDDTEDAAIIGAIIALAHSLSLVVTAEGVETRAQKEFLIKSGCDELQGYLMSRPITDIDFIKYAKNLSGS